jgi:hypothetical protein
LPGKEATTCRMCPLRYLSVTQHIIPLAITKSHCASIIIGNAADRVQV